MYFYPDAVSCTLLRLPREKRRLLLLWTQILCLGFPGDVVSTCSFRSFYALLCLRDIWFWQCTSCCLSQVSYRHMVYTLMKDWPTYIYLSSCEHSLSVRTTQMWHVLWHVFLSDGDRYLSPFRLTQFHGQPPVDGSGFTQQLRWQSTLLHLS